MLRDLHWRGFNLILCARNKEKLDDVCSQIELKYGVNAVSTVADVSIADEVSKLIEFVKDHYAAIDILINNAGRRK